MSLTFFQLCLIQNECTFCKSINWQIIHQLAVNTGSQFMFFKNKSAEMGLAARLKSSDIEVNLFNLSEEEFGHHC